MTKHANLYSRLFGRLIGSGRKDRQIAQKEEHDAPFREVQLERDPKIIERVRPFVLPRARLPPGCVEGAPELLPGLLMAVAVQVGDELGFLPSEELRYMLRAEWVRIAAIANLEKLPHPRLDRIPTAEGRVDSDILLLRSDDPFCASRVSYLDSLVKWASGGQPTPLGVLVSIPTWHRTMLHVLSGPGVAKVLERMAVATQIDFLEAPEHTRVSPDLYFVAPDGRTQTVVTLQRGEHEANLVIETRGLIGEYLFGPNGAYADLSTAGAQEGDLAEAQRLNGQVAQHYAAGKYQQAIPLAQRALAITENAIGSEHPETARALHSLAALYYASSDYAKAEPLFERALAIREKALGPEHPDTAIPLISLAALYTVTGTYTKVEPLVERALAIITETGPDREHPNAAFALNNLAEMYRATATYARAKPLYRRALAITEKALGPEHPETARSLNNLAELYRAMGAYAKAEPLYQRALAIREKALGPEHPDTATVLNNLAGLHADNGAYAKAEPLCRRALAICEKALGPEHPDTAAVLNILAKLHNTTDAYAKAEPLYRRALTIREKALGTEHPATAVSLNNLAQLYHVTGVPVNAETLYQRALTITEKALGPEHPNTALTLNNLAELYRAAGAYAKAEPLYRRALAIYEKALGPEHSETAIPLNNLALLCQMTGAYAKAESLNQRALAIYEKALGPEHPNTAKSLANLAALYYATGAYARAEPHFERAQSINEINTARFLLSGDEARKRAYLQGRFGEACAHASFSLAAADPRARALGLTAVLQYKGRVLDAIARSAALLRSSVDPRDQALFDEFAAVAQQLSALIFRGPGNLSSQAYRERTDALAREQERLEGELSARSAAFRQAVAPITLEDVRQGLPADTALVEWFRYLPFDPKGKDEKTRWSAPRYVVYVLRRKSDPAAIDLGAAQDIDKLVGDFRTALSDPARASYREVAQDLFAKLIKPLLSSLSGMDRLLLSPDGALNLMPVAALMDEHGEYVAQRFDLTYLTSGRDLLALAAPAPARGRPVVMADPDYGPSTTDIGSYRSSDPRSIDLDRSSLVFRPLAGTAGEAKALQGLLKLDAQEVLTGANATEEKLKALHGPRILHVATHGFFLSDQQVAAAALQPISFGAEMPPLPLGENPLLRSGLALAGANARRSGENDDGILTAAEAAQLDLHSTQLVVLSACETGLGDVQQGEGVYGLRRALVLAGARAQLVSLWKVADAQTQALMVDYYQRLLRGEARSAALREAQKAMIANPATRHPYYWAAFVPIGDWTPLAANG
jgi:CHAT domain-containing protein/Tfp pilus assembly protein PilF